MYIYIIYIYIYIYIKHYIYILNLHTLIFLNRKLSFLFCFLLFYLCSLLKESQLPCTPVQHTRAQYGIIIPFLEKERTVLGKLTFISVFIFLVARILTFPIWCLGLIDRVQFSFISLNFGKSSRKKGWLLLVTSEAFLCFPFTIWKISLWNLKLNIYATNTFCMLICQEVKSHFLTFPESQGLWGIPHLLPGCSTLALHLVFFSKYVPLRSSLIWIVLNSSNFLMSLGHCSTCVAVPPGE